MVKIQPEAALPITYQELQRGVDPEVLADLGYEVPEQYRRPVTDLGETVVASVGSEIPPAVRAELQAFRDAHPIIPRTDERHISGIRALRRGEI